MRNNKQITHSNMRNVKFLLETCYVTKLEKANLLIDTIIQRHKKIILSDQLIITVQRVIAVTVVQLQKKNFGQKKSMRLV